MKKQLLILALFLIAFASCKKDDPVEAVVPKQDNPNIVGNVYIPPSGMSLSPYYNNGYKVVSTNSIVYFHYRILDIGTGVQYENPSILHTDTYKFKYPDIIITDKNGNNSTGIFSFGTDKLTFADGAYILHKRGNYSKFDKLLDEIR